MSDIFNSAILYNNLTKNINFFLRFVNDMEIMTDDTTVLKIMILKLKGEVMEYGIKINIKKTNILIINDRQIVKVKLKKKTIELTDK